MTEGSFLLRTLRLSSTHSLIINIDILETMYTYVFTRILIYNLYAYTYICMYICVVCVDKFLRAYVNTRRTCSQDELESEYEELLPFRRAL